MSKFNLKNDIPSRQLTQFSFDKEMQIIPIEINLRKQKWLLFNIYRPPKQDPKFFIQQLSEGLDFYMRNYDNIIIDGDFNLTPDSPVLDEFIEVNSFYNHMKEKTCWKSTQGSCIDLIMSNRKSSLMNILVLETGLSDHHLLIYTMLKTTYDKLRPVKISYRKYKHFNKNHFL